MRFLPTRFERAYIRLYNNRITVGQFLAQCGVQGKAEAWKALCEYRTKVERGELPDPRDTYHCWRIGGPFNA